MIHYAAIDNETVWYGCCHHKSLKHVALDLELHGRQRLEGPGGERPEGPSEHVSGSLRGREEIVGGDTRESEENVIESWRKGDPVPESLATLSCEVIQKIRNTSNELSDLAKEISRQNTESAICLPHATYDKT